MKAIINTDTQNFLSVTRDSSTVVLGENKFGDGIYNHVGVDVILEAGTVLGRVNSTDKIAFFDGGAATGLENILGVLPEDTVVTAGDQSIPFAESGMISEGKLVFENGEVLTDIVGGRTVRDKFKTDNLGIDLVLSQELSR